jgi:hypothetical protein
VQGPRHGVCGDVGIDSTLFNVQAAVLRRKVPPSMPVHARPAGTNRRSRHNSANSPARGQPTDSTNLAHC